MSEAFSGETPYGICQQYAAGRIDRAQLVDELTRFPYLKGGHTDGYDSLIVDPPGTWSEVSDALRRGLIEDDVYEEVFNRRHALDFEERWSELFESLSPRDRKAAVLACWRVLNDGWKLTRADVQAITTKVVQDPEQFETLYGEYKPRP